MLRALALVPGRAWMLAAYHRVPGVRAACEVGYRFVADHRVLASRITGWLWGRDLRPASHVLTHWLVLRGLGLVTLCAALSLWVQLDGLLGSDGILPAQDFIERVSAHADRARWTEAETFLRVPTLAWWSASNAALHVLCGLTTVAGLLLLFNILPGLAVLVAYVSYLSLYTVGDTFLGYQWDILLLESLVAALLITPWAIRPGFRLGVMPSISGRWVFRLLVFKLMLLSGAVKLLSNDAVWTDLTALTYHYWTQPIPTWTSYPAHHLPLWIHKASTAGMFAVELGLPFLIFGPRRLRLVAFCGFVALQLGIAATGNYGYFNLLSLVLCLALLDDGAVRAFTPRRWRGWWPDVYARWPRPGPLWRRLPVRVVALVVVALSLSGMAQRLDRTLEVPKPLAAVERKLSPWQFTSNYGLFANMTESRPEVILEGSADGETWLPYHFPWKAGALDTLPGFTGPHMPRVDWQLWFAALRGQCHRTRWYLPFLKRLLEGSESVEALLAENPFPDAPPRHLRSRLYHYTFTEPQEREDTGHLWRREWVGSYCPTLMLQDGRLARSPAKDPPPAP